MAVELRGPDSKVLARIERIGIQASGPVANGHRILIRLALTLMPRRPSGVQSSDSASYARLLVDRTELTMVCETEELILGSFHPLEQHRATLEYSNDVQHDREVLLYSDVAFAYVASIEDFRRGRKLSFGIKVVGEVVMQSGEGRRVDCSNQFMQYDRDAWIEFLDKVGIADVVSLELPITRKVDDVRAEAVQKLRETLRVMGKKSPDETLSDCRKVLEKLSQSGFGGHTSKDVYAFIKEKASSNSLDEKVGALRAALEMFLSCAEPLLLSI